MKSHLHIKAKGGAFGISLHDHLCHAATAIEPMAVYCGVNARTARIGALLHDIGKAHPLFRQQLEGMRPAQTFRHELASLFFLPLVKKRQRPMVLEMIVAHHKSIRNDYGEKGLLDLLEYQQDVCSFHLGNWEEWSLVALDILGSLGMETKRIGRDEAIEAWNEAVSYCQRIFRTKKGPSLWRGLLMSADHIASEMEDKTNDFIHYSFRDPDLSIFDRPDPRYPLSLIAADNHRLHTIAISPTSSGKTDFLLRRCKGRIFYILPYQAPINALYHRVKKDFPGFDADIRMMHAGIPLGIHRLAGAALKILTPYQLTGLLYATKGYESLLLDITGCDVILDEIHVYSGIPNAIVMKLIELLNSLDCRIHIASATLPTVLRTEITRILTPQKTQVVRLTHDQLKTYNRHRIHKIPNWLATVVIVERAIERGEKILVVVNRVKRSQQLFRIAKRMFPRVAKLLLHRRYRHKDRMEKESSLLNEFNLSSSGCLVVATQVVEVSLDIDFDLLITEMAPLDCLIQRMGRINRRRSNLGKISPVYILPPPQRPSAAFPYDHAVLVESYRVLEDGMVFKEESLQKKIDTVFPEKTIPDIEIGTALKKTGRWSIPMLSNGSSIVLDKMDIDNAVCIRRSDVEAYQTSSSHQKLQYEIPVYHYSMAAYSRLADGADSPFVIPDSAYDHELGLIFN